MKTKLFFIVIGLPLFVVVYTQFVQSVTAESDTTKASKGETKMSEPKDKSKSTPAPGDTVKTESGLSYLVKEAGEGPRALTNQTVAAHFIGKLAETGTEFYNSYKESSPLEFALGRGEVIQGCDEGITGMAVGETRRLFIPYLLAYGEHGYPAAKIPPKSDLIFDIELVSIKPDKK